MGWLKSAMVHSAGPRWLAVLVTVSVVMMAGCLSGAGPSASPTQPSDDTSSPAAPTAPTESPQPAEQPCPETISFWNLGSPDSHHAGWSATEVSIGFYSPGDADVFFVMYENDTILGMDRWTQSNAVHVDGFTITLDELLDGNHTIRVVAYPDTNGNGEFDRGTDRPCFYNGTRDQAGPITINFSSFSATETDS